MNPNLPIIFISILFYLVIYIIDSYLITTKTLKILLITSIGLMTLGTLLNLLAVISNHNYMPVYYPQGNFDQIFPRHFYYTEFNQVKFPYLTDIIPAWNSRKSSIGDLFLFAGLLPLIPLNLYILIQANKSSSIKNIKRKGLKG